MAKKKALTKGKLAQIIVTKLVRKNKIVWPRDMKMAKKLIDFYPEEEFWKSFEPRYQMFSLAYYLAEDGKKELENHSVKMNLTDDYKEPNFKFEEENVESSKQINSKPKTMKEFLHYGAN